MAELVNLIFECILERLVAVSKSHNGNARTKIEIFLSISII